MTFRISILTMSFHDTSHASISIMSCHVKPCPWPTSTSIMSWPCHDLPVSVPCHAMSCHAMSCHTALHPITPCPSSSSGAIIGKVTPAWQYRGLNLKYATDKKMKKRYVKITKTYIFDFELLWLGNRAKLILILNSILTSHLPSSLPSSTSKPQNIHQSTQISNTLQTVTYIYIYTCSASTSFTQSTTWPNTS